ncbi:hypothetical protein BX589_13982 [Paraburkholderia fungorum]|jgi:hypothetical protein|nr:hypothetical protein BX589_13982 [Paraburkholderia fungorum]
MNKSTITRLNNKFDVVIHNINPLSGNYKMSFDMHTNSGTKEVVVKSSESISDAIDRVLN